MKLKTTLFGNVYQFKDVKEVLAKANELRSGDVLALPASLPVRYAAVLTVINALVDFVARFPNPHPLLVVAGQDFGKALGMLLRPQLQQLPLAVIDEVIVRAGDYIDIGTPLFGRSVVPVTVKSLAFPS